LTRMEVVTLTKWSFSALLGMAYNIILSQPNSTSTQLELE
jgi:hypothetical protein